MLHVVILDLVAAKDRGSLLFRYLLLLYELVLDGKRARRHERSAQEGDPVPIFASLGWGVVQFRVKTVRSLVIKGS